MAPPVFFSRYAHGYKLHYTAEDVWISGYLSDYTNVSRRWLPGSYSTLRKSDFVGWKTKDYILPILEQILFAIANKSYNQRNNMTRLIRPESPDQFSATTLHTEWFSQQVAASALYINGAHLKISARELRCLWKKGITIEQLYIDNLMYEYSSNRRSRSFNQLIQQYANRIMPSAPVPKARVRFKCLA